MSVTTLVQLASRVSSLANSSKRTSWSSGDCDDVEQILIAFLQFCEPSKSSEEVCRNGLKQVAAQATAKQNANLVVGA
jgi:hypothetical protein